MSTLPIMPLPIHYEQRIAELEQQRDELLAAVEQYKKLLEQADHQLRRWQEKYGRHQPDWLPPADDVTLQELIADAAIAKVKP